jgi:Cation transporting ATPase, C-terminus
VTLRGERNFWALEARGLVEARNLAFSVLVQLAIHHLPATQQLFSIGALSLYDCALSLLIGALPLLILEIMKVLRCARGGGAGVQMQGSSTVAHRATN